VIAVAPDIAGATQITKMEPPLLVAITEVGGLGGAVEPVDKKQLEELRVPPRGHVQYEE
jgi:hypothetical protein